MFETFDKEDMNRCLEDWYSRGGNIIIEGDTLRNRYEGNYRRMPKFHILREYDEVRRGKKFRENCQKVIENLSH